MTRYLIRRLLNMIPLLLLVTIISFAIMRLAPGGPEQVLLGQELQAGIDVEKMEELREKWGLNKSIPEQYLTWITNMLKGDMGRSFYYRVDATEIIKRGLWPSLQLNLASLILTYAIAIPVGIVAATRQYSLLDHVVTTIAFIGYAAPTYWIALLLIYFVAIRTKWFPTNGFRTTGYKVETHGLWTVFVDRLHYMTLPLVVNVFGGLTGLTRFMRSSMLEVLKEDYVRTARAKGLSDRVVIYKHALRNALLPIITLSGGILAGLIGGSVILETLFSWPGLGRIYYDSVVARDYNVVMALTVFSSILTMIGFFLVDVAYVLVDPRIKFD